MDLALAVSKFPRSDTANNWARRAGPESDADLIVQNCVHNVGFKLLRRKVVVCFLVMFFDVVEDSF